jgi:hypothetical protein
MIRIDASAARSMTERFSKHLERIIREPLAFRKEARGPEMQLLRKGLMPRSLLIRLTRHMKSREIGEALAAMAEADVIGEGEDDDEKTFYWWKATESKRGWIGGDWVVPGGGVTRNSRQQNQRQPDPAPKPSRFNVIPRPENRRY